jgi:hypothetical protein
MKELLLQSLVISLFCVGLRIVSGPGMILYFLRMPFEWAKENNKHYLVFALKPFIGCIGCMGSVWTLVISLVYFEISLYTIPQILIVCGLNAIIHKYFESI